MSTPPPDSPRRNSNPFGHLTQSILSYDGNIMLAAIISLLLVILFVLLLHVYAKWFLMQARHRRRSSVSVSHVLGPARFHHFHTFTVDTTFWTSPTKGLDPSIIASIPLFVYDSDEQKRGSECVICLSVFEDEDVGRLLPKCGHAFHVECIDMWLHSHSNCPICRAPVVCENKIHEDLVEQRRGELSEALTASELCEIDANSTLEIMVEVPISEDESLAMHHDSLSTPSSLSQASSSPLGGSLKRMLSRNRSETKNLLQIVRIMELRVKDWKVRDSIFLFPKISSRFSPVTG
ncbi:hypothetical protein F0562_001093 [Nyssa sinensis]|uniref:RING-type E3 ubiquitin transferase n=1 Tax=Nyssa sinensis TaxID=561372 RepID=A0A5J5C3Q3_9ASTE|nr:hypothetical protein F0562_001093 [Nyssa sinensis]